LAVEWSVAGDNELRLKLNVRRSRRKRTRTRRRRRRTAVDSRKTMTRCDGSQSRAEWNAKR
jgi:hypothetical protein